MEVLWDFWACLGCIIPSPSPKPIAQTLCRVFFGRRCRLQCPCTACGQWGCAYRHSSRWIGFLLTDNVHVRWNGAKKLRCVKNVRSHWCIYIFIFSDRTGGGQGHIPNSLPKFNRKRPWRVTGSTNAIGSRRKSSSHHHFSGENFCGAYGDDLWFFLTVPLMAKNDGELFDVWSVWWRFGPSHYPPYRQQQL